MGFIPAVAVVDPDELVAVDAVEGQDEHHDEIGDEDEGIEAAGAIVAVEDFALCGLAADAL